MTHKMEVTRKVEVRVIDSGSRLSLGAARAAINRAAKEARIADAQDAGQHRADRWNVEISMAASPFQARLRPLEDTLNVVAERAL